MMRSRSLALVFAAALSFAGLARGAEVIESQAGRVAVESLAKFDSPWGMTWLPGAGGKLLVTEKPGRLRIFHDGKVSEPIAGTPTVAFAGQGGLLDVEVDPSFASNRLVYLSYAEPDANQPTGATDPGDPRLGTNFKGDDVILKGGAVARAKLSDDLTKLTDLQVIWRQTPKTIGRGHFGGRLAFSPDGKFLFITSGERQRFEPAQDMASNLGKIIRIHPDGSIPQDNPFAGKGDAQRADVWTLGNRNPLGFAFDPRTGKLWLNEMGPKGGDELLLIEPGKNYGWPLVCEGVHYNDAPIPKHATHTDLAPPAKEWTPVISPSGMIFYTGKLFPKWTNNAFIGGLSSKALVRVALDETGSKFASDEKINLKRRIRDVIQAEDGAILLLTDGAGAELLRLTPAASASR